MACRIEEARQDTSSVRSARCKRSAEVQPREHGVTGVPMFVIGDRVLTGLQDKETLQALIEEELAQ